MSAVPADLPKTRGQRVVDFIEHFCVVPEGEHVGQLMRLADFQRRFILAIYDNSLGTRRAYLSIGRKNGKSGLVAAILLAHIVGPEARLNTQIISGAQSRDQAALIFSLASKMVYLSPRLRTLARCVPSTKRIYGLTRRVEYHAISAESKTAFGLSPALAILDEVGQVRGPTSEFIDAITTSQGAHADPLLIAISTQAPNDADMFSVWIDDAKRSKDRRVVCHVYEAPAECALDDVAAWKAANPAMGLFRSTKDVEEQAERAIRMPSSEPTFRNLTLNQRVEIFSPFVSKNVWALCSMEPDLAAFYEVPVFVGLDLSGKNDLTAAVLAAWHGDKWHVRPQFWTPEKSLKERSRQSRTPMDEWARRGFLKVVPGASIDYEVIAKDLIDLFEGMAIGKINFDRWRIDLLKKELEKLSAPFLAALQPMGQGFKDMAPALDTLETCLLNEQIAHGQHPVLTAHMMCARVEKDAAGNRKFSKLKATGRIDGAVALAMALAAGTSIEEKPPEFKSFFV